MNAKQFLKTATIAIVTALVMIPMPSRAQEKFKVNGSSYTITSPTTVAITYYEDKKISTTHRIPSRVTYNGKTYSVTEAKGLIFRWDWNDTYEGGTLIIPKTIKKITFWGGPYGRLSLEQGNPRYYISNGALIDKIDHILIACPCTKTGTYTIPSTVKRIENDAFYDSWIVSVIIPNSVKEIGDRAFHSCTKLTSVSIGNGITSIGSRVFDLCYELSSVSVPASLVDKIKGKAIFKDSENLASVTVRYENGTKRQDSEWYWFKTSAPAPPSINPNTVSIPSYYTVEYGDWSEAAGNWIKKIVFSDGTKTHLFKKYENGRIIYWGEDVYTTRYKTEQDAAATVWVNLKCGKLRTVGAW